MEYFESDAPAGNGLCSDNACPCPEVSIPRGTGYIYIDQALVDFRRKFPTLAAARKAMQAQHEQRKADFGGGVSMFYSLGPILVCEEGARLRGLNLEVAAEDARHWWETGQVPLRATPTCDEQKKEGQEAEEQSAAPNGADAAKTIPKLTSSTSDSETTPPADSTEQCSCEKDSSSGEFICDNCGKPIGWEPVVLKDRDDFRDLSCEKCPDILIPKAAGFHLDILGKSIPCPLCGSILQTSSAGLEPWDLTVFKGSSHLSSEESLLAEVKKLTDAVTEDLKPEALAKTGMLPAEAQLAGRLILCWLEKNPNLTDPILNAGLTNWVGHVPIGMLSKDGVANLSAEQKEGFFVIMHYGSAFIHQLDARVSPSKFAHGMRGSLILSFMTCHPEWKETPFNNLFYDGRLGIEELVYTLKQDKDAYPDNSKKAGSWAQFDQALNNVIPKAEQALGCRQGDVRDSQGAAKDSKCFVATAAYATDANQVKILRRFRDEILVRSDLGRGFIHWYGLQGPKLAAYISHKPFVRSLCRIFLYPFVWSAAFLILFSQIGKTGSRFLRKIGH